MNDTSSDSKNSSSLWVPKHLLALTIAFLSLPSCRLHFLKTGAGSLALFPGPYGFHQEHLLDSLNTCEHLGSQGPGLCHGSCVAGAPVLPVHQLDGSFQTTWMGQVKHLSQPIEGRGSFPQQTPGSRTLLPYRRPLTLSQITPLINATLLWRRPGERKHK